MCGAVGSLRAMSEQSKHRPDATDAVWLRSKHAAPGERAVEIAFVEDMILMRDSAKPEGPILYFTQAEWDAFVGGARLGEFDFDDEEQPAS